MTLAALLILAPLTVAQVPSTMEATYTWDYPTTGNPVVYFEVQVKMDQGDFEFAQNTTTNEITLMLDLLHGYQVRVRGVDALDHAGPWSTPSDLYTPDAGAPGACGKPSTDRM